jgi:hypothetical protein
MKKLISLITIILFSFSLSAQTFDGVPISGDVQTAISRFKAKGYFFKEISDNGTAILKGKIAGIYDIELFIFVTPKTKKITKMVAYLDKQQTWFNLKSDYQKFVEILTEKYGSPDNTYNSFDSPYYDGDGYEMTAVSLEKCTFASLWLRRSNLNLAIEISKFSQVKLTYENVENMAILKSELAEMQNKSF